MPRGKLQQSNTTSYIWLICGGVVLLLAAAYFLYVLPTEHSDVAQSDAGELKDKICIRQEEYIKLVEKAAAISQSPQSPQSIALPQQQTVAERDYRVIADPLFPPMNRTDAGTYQSLQNSIQKRDLYVGTSVRSVDDSYRLVGYLVNKDAGDAGHDSGGNNWKLMARMKDKNTADFYMIPANRNYDMKIHITNDMVNGERLRDIYTIPNSISFNSPLLHTTPYEFVEVDKSDLTSTNGGMYM